MGIDLGARLKAKRESISSHVAWGALVANYIGCGADAPLFACAVAIFVGFAWEVGTALISRGRWKPDLLDLPPWVLGGVLGAGLPYF